jgi:L-rhamnose mutarotase
MKKNRYCLIIELKPEYVEEYCDIHRKAWPELLRAIKDAGAEELLIWNYKNFSIVYYECDDLDAVYEKLGGTEIAKKWNTTVGPWFAESPTLDGSDSVGTLEKIFDLNQQLEGGLEQY